MSGTTVERTRRRWWRRVAFGGSVVLNLFLLAHLGGQILRPTLGLGQRPMFTMVLTEAEARLPPDDAQRFRAVMQHDAPTYMVAAHGLAQSRERIYQLMTAEPFDPVALRSQIATWRGNWSSFTDTFSDALVDAMTQISPAGRRMLVGVIAEQRGASLAAKPAH